MIERLIQSAILAQRPRTGLAGVVIIMTAFALFTGMKAFLIQKGWILSDSQKRRQR